MHNLQKNCYVLLSRIIISGTFPAMTVIVLAAGLSSRMGDNKLLLPLNGKPLILSTIAAAASFSDSVIAVIGHERERMEGILQGTGARIVYCPDYIKGQKQSTLAGIREIDDDFAILPGDLPLVTADDFEGPYRLLASHEISRAIYQGTPGHPVMFRKEHKEKLLSFEGTMKEYLSLYDVAAYNGSIGCVLDADTPQRYQEIISRL